MASLVEQLSQLTGIIGTPQEQEKARRRFSQIKQEALADPLEVTNFSSTPGQPHAVQKKMSDIVRTTQSRQDSLNKRMANSVASTAPRKTAAVTAILEGIQEEDLSAVEQLKKLPAPIRQVINRGVSDYLTQNQFDMSQPGVQQESTLLQNVAKVTQGPVKEQKDLAFSKYTPIEKRMAQPVGSSKQVADVLRLGDKDIPPMLKNFGLKRTIEKGKKLLSEEQTTSLDVLTGIGKEIIDKWSGVAEDPTASKIGGAAITTGAGAIASLPAVLFNRIQQVPVIGDAIDFVAEGADNVVNVINGELDKVSQNTPEMKGYIDNFLKPAFDTVAQFAIWGGVMKAGGNFVKYKNVEIPITDIVKVAEGKAPATSGELLAERFLAEAKAKLGMETEQVLDLFKQEGGTSVTVPTSRALLSELSGRVEGIWQEMTGQSAPAPVIDLLASNEGVAKVVVTQLENYANMFRENRMVGFKGKGDGSVRPGINVPAPLPEGVELDKETLEPLFRSGEKGNYFSTSREYIQEGGWKGPIREIAIDKNTRLLDAKDYNNFNKLLTPEEFEVYKRATKRESTEIQNKVLERNGYDGMRITDEGRGGKIYETVFLTDKNVVTKEPTTSKKPTIKPEPPTGKKVRIQTRRLLESDQVSDEFKQLIRDNPDAYYDAITDKEADIAIANLTQPELRDMFFDGTTKLNDYAGFKLTQQLQAEAEALRAKGLEEEANSKLEEAETITLRAMENATKAGQRVQAQKKWVEWLGPLMKVKNLKSEALKLGREITKDQEKLLKDLFEKEKKLKAQIEAARTEAIQGFDKAKVKVFKKLQDEYNANIREITKKSSTILPRKISDTLITIMQGNILTPISQIKNILFNAFFLPAAATSKAVGSLGDMAVSYLRKIPGTGILEKIPSTTIFGQEFKPGEFFKKDRTLYSGNPVEYVKGFGQGAAEAAESFAKGAMPGDLAKVERHKSLEPFAAIASAWTGKNMAVNPKTGKPFAYDRFEKALRGALGMPPEVMFSLLALGDKPFYRGAQRSLLAELAKLRGLKGDEAKAMIRFPDDLSIEEVELLARSTVFQQESGVANWVNKGVEGLGKIPGIGGLAKWAARVPVLFVTTPVNVVSESLQYLVPPISISQGFYNALKGDRRKSMLSFGKAVVGTMILAVAAKLVEEKLVNGDTYENPKQNALDYAQLPPRSINISGVQRMIRGESTKLQPGDVVVSYEQFGLLGGAIEMEYSKAVSPAEEKRTKKADNSLYRNSVNFLGEAMASMFRVGSFAMNQTFLEGTATIFEALSTSDTSQGESKLKRVLRNYMTLGVSILAPNTLAAATRSNETFIRVKDDTEPADIMDAVIKERSFDLQDYPVKVGLLGEKILQTPDGAHPLIYNLIDSFKTREVADDKRYFKMSELFEKTGDQGVIPPIPSSSVSYGGEKIELDKKSVKYQRYLEKIGKERGKLLTDLMNSTFFKKLQPAEQAEVWKDAIDDGYKIGQAKYFKDEIPESTLTDEWEIAYLNPDITRATLGTALKSIGKEVNKSGAASSTQWRDYEKKRYQLTHGTTVKLDLGIKKIQAKNPDITNTGLHKLLQEEVTAGRLSLEGAEYVYGQLEEM